MAEDNLQKWYDHAQKHKENPTGPTSSMVSLMDWADKFENKLDSKEAEDNLKARGFDPDYPPEA